MKGSLLAGTVHDSTGTTGAASWPRAGENLVVSLGLAIMAILPIAEIVLRATFGIGISGSTTWVQHLTLIIGMLGGAVAAREGRLLSLSTGAALLPGISGTLARSYASIVATVVSAYLAAAGLQFVLVERDAGGVLAAGIPNWVVQLVIPGGFAVIAWRLVERASPTWRGRLLVAAIALLAGLSALVIPWPPSALVLPCLLLLLIATAMGAPIFTALGGAALILFWGSEVPIAAIPVEMYRLVVSPTLPTIPLFTLAGYFLAEGGASRRLVRVFKALAGWIPGGPAIVTVLVCAFFTSFTGASGVTILALGGLLMPILLTDGYPGRSALGLLTASGSLGLLFPPSLAVILYGIVSHTPIDRLFLGGFIPGMLMLAVTAWWGSRQGAGSTSRSPFDPREALDAVREAKWELTLPVVVLVGLYGGFATLVEAAALTALYAFVVETFVYRDLRVRKDTTRVMTECGVLVGGVLLILGVALGFTNYLVDARIPAQMVEWVQGAIDSRLTFLLLLNLFLLLVGCLMDIFSAIVVVVPLIAPIAAAFGVDPIHLGIIFLANMELGYLTPPVGMNLFLSSYRFGKPLPEVYRSVVPLLLVLLAAVLLITYVPPLTTSLPALLGR